MPRPTEHTNPKKRIMRALKIDEVSAVSFPAKGGATVRIMKRDDRDDVNEIFFNAHARKYNSPDRAAMNAAYGGAGEHAKQRWLACVERVRSRDGCDGVTALRTARKEYPSEFADFQTVAAHSDPYRGQLSKKDDEMHKVVEAPVACLSFEDAVAEIRKREGCTGTQAYQKAADRHPVLLQKMRTEAIAAARMALDALELARKAKDTCLETPEMDEDDEDTEQDKRKETAGKKFADHAAEIAKTEGCSGTEGYQKARVRYPELVEAMSS